MNPGVVGELNTPLMGHATHVTILVALAVYLAICLPLLPAEMGASIAATATRTALVAFTRTDKVKAMNKKGRHPPTVILNPSLNGVGFQSINLHSLSVLAQVTGTSAGLRGAHSISAFFPVSSSSIPSILITE